MEPKNYKKIGKLPKETIDFFLEEINKRKKSNTSYQFVWFDHYLEDKFLQIFENTELKIHLREDTSDLPNQKAFCSAPNHGFMIHKDGWINKAALNIALSCNPGDWVRWHDEDLVNSFGKISPTDYSHQSFTKSRNATNIKNYEYFPYTEQLRNEIGDVYVLDTGVYHSFKCSGPKDRIILQTKFEGFPNLEKLINSLSVKSFKNIIKL